MIAGSVSSVSNLLPNLDDLLTELPGATSGVEDARAIVEAAAAASTLDDLDKALGALTLSWRQA